MSPGMAHLKGLPHGLAKASLNMGLFFLNIIGANDTNAFLKKINCDAWLSPVDSVVTGKSKLEFFTLKIIQFIFDKKTTRQTL